MRLFEKAADGGLDSGVKGFYIIEIKNLFSIVLLKFNPNTREAYHNHAFNAVTFWLKGKVKEELLSGEVLSWSSFQLKYTPRTNYHRIQVQNPAYAISFRGPWTKTWNEVRCNKLVTLTNGRKEV